MHPTDEKENKEIQQQHNTHLLKANQFQWETIFIMFCCLFVSFGEKKVDFIHAMEFPFDFHRWIFL